jgi:hypothetical protein
MSILKNTAGQYLYIAVNSTSGTAITSGTVNGFRSIDGGAQASVTGTISHKGNGQWELALSQADTNGDQIGFQFTHASAIPVGVMVYTETVSRASRASQASVDALNNFDPATEPVTLTTAERISIADALLARDWTAVTGEAARSVLNALRFLRNKFAVSGTTLTIYKEDDVTTAWTATVATDAAADPVTGSDPD